MWIKGCVESATTSMLVNGSPSGEFTFNRGLRQGDPLSHFLFLLAAEGLSLLISSGCENNLLSPAKIGRENVILSHLQYADDTIFVCNKGLENVLSIKRVMHLFKLMSGLKVNFHKCKLVGVNLSDGELTRYARVFGLFN